MGLFKKGTKDKFKKIPLTDAQKKAEAFQSSLIDRDINFAQQGIAGLSSLEQAGLDQFGGLAGLDTAGVAQSALTNLQQTLSGGTDPRTSPFFQGFRQEAQRLKGEGISDALRRSQRLTGAPAGRAQRAAGEVAGRADESILQVLGGLFEQERGRQFQAIGQGLNAPGAIGGMLLQAGQVPRGIEQQILNARFQQNQQNILAPFQLQNPIAQQQMQQERFVFKPGQEGSTFMEDVAGIAGIAGTFMGVPGGGGMPGGGNPIGMAQASVVGGGGFSRGIGSFLSGGGGLNSGPTSLFDINAGMPGQPPAFGSSFNPNFQQFGSFA